MMALRLRLSRPGIGQLSPVAPKVFEAKIIILGMMIPGIIMMIMMIMALYQVVAEIGNSEIYALANSGPAPPGRGLTSRGFRGFSESHSAVGQDPDLKQLPAAGPQSLSTVTQAAASHRVAFEWRRWPHCGCDYHVTLQSGFDLIASQLGPLARPGPEAAVKIVIAEFSSILLWPFCHQPDSKANPKC